MVNPAPFPGPLGGPPANSSQSINQITQGFSVAPNTTGLHVSPYSPGGNISQGTIINQPHASDSTENGYGNRGMIPNHPYFAGKPVDGYGNQGTFPGQHHFAAPSAIQHPFPSRSTISDYMLRTSDPDILASMAPITGPVPDFLADMDPVASRSNPFHGQKRFAQIPEPLAHPPYGMQPSEPAPGGAFSSGNSTKPPAELFPQTLRHNVETQYPDFSNSFGDNFGNNFGQNAGNVMLGNGSPDTNSGPNINYAIYINGGWNYYDYRNSAPSIAPPQPGSMVGNTMNRHQNFNCYSHPTHNSVSSGQGDYSGQPGADCDTGAPSPAHVNNQLGRKSKNAANRNGEITSPAARQYPAGGVSESDHLVVDYHVAISKQLLFGSPPHHEGAPASGAPSPVGASTGQAGVAGTILKGQIGINSKGKIVFPKQGRRGAPSIATRQEKDRIDPSRIIRRQEQKLQAAARRKARKEEKEAAEAAEVAANVAGVVVVQEAPNSPGFAPAFQDAPIMNVAAAAAQSLAPGPERVSPIEPNNAAINHHHNNEDEANHQAVAAELQARNPEIGPASGMKNLTHVGNNEEKQNDIESRNESSPPVAPRQAQAQSATGSECACDILTTLFGSELHQPEFLQSSNIIDPKLLDLKHSSNTMILDGPINSEQLLFKYLLNRARAERQKNSPHKRITRVSGHTGLKLIALPSDASRDQPREFTDNLSFPK